MDRFSAIKHFCIQTHDLDSVGGTSNLMKSFYTTGGNDKHEMHEKEATLTLITPDMTKPSTWQLYFNHHYIAANNWKFDKDELMLTFKQVNQANQLNVAGTLQMKKDLSTGFGHLSVGDQHYSAVLGLAPVSFDVDVSANAGAYIVQSGNVYQIKWDSNKDQWKNATWQTKRMELTYGLNSVPFVGQTDYVKTFIVKDNLSNNQWEAEQDTFTVSLNADYQYSFIPTGTPPQDISTDTTIPSVFPYKLDFIMDEFGLTFAGAMTINDSPKGEKGVIAIKGTLKGFPAFGHYNLQKGKVSHHMSVFPGKVEIEGVKPASFSLENNMIHYKGLNVKGLPTDGCFCFDYFGNIGMDTKNQLSAVRCENHKMPTRVRAMAAAATGLDIHTLLNMTPFYKNDKGSYYDKFQQQALDDFYSILYYWMPNDLRKFVPPSNLPDDIKDVVNIPSADKAKTFYNNLNIAHITTVLGNQDDPYAKKLNAIRASNYIKGETAKSEVFNAQISEIYKRKWLASQDSNGDLKLFLADQVRNASKYVDYINADQKSWIASLDTILDTSDEDQKTKQEMTKIINLLSDKARNDKQYWSYTFFRFATNPSALMQLKYISIDPNAGVDGSAFMRRVQANCAILGIMDPSLTFQKQYMSVIRIFQVGNILPQLLEMANVDIDDYSFIVYQILQKYIEENKNSQDPKIQELVNTLQSKLQIEHIRNILSEISIVASNVKGGNWITLANAIDNALVNRPILKGIVNFLGKAVFNAVLMTGFIAGVANIVFAFKSWKLLDDAHKAQAILMSIQLLSPVLVAIVKRGVAWYAAFDTGNLTFSSFYKILIDSGEEIASAELRLSGSMSKWIVRNNPVPVEGYMYLPELFGEVAEEELTLTQKLLGRNLTEFMATRFAALFAVINIVMSSIFLARSESTLDKAQNGLFLASAILELVAAAANWAIGAGVEVVLGIELATVASIAGGLAILGAVVGVVLLLVILLKHQPTVVETFATENAGVYYMPEEGDIDYLNKDYVSIISNGKVVTVNDNNTLTLGNQQNNSKTVYLMDVDDNGYGLFKVITSDKVYALTLNDDKKLVMSEMITDTTNDADKKQRWVFSVKGGVTKNDQGLMTGGNFSLYNLYFNNKKQEKLYLNVSNSNVIVSNSEQQFTISSTAKKPEGLTMDDISLTVDDRDMTFDPKIAIAGTLPYTFSVKPNLPNFLQFSTSGGRISQAVGVAPPITAKTEYTLTVTNGANAPIDTKFHIEVTKGY
ncbi:hypothetical protein ABK040_001038 [Willaertia magna]